MLQPWKLKHRPSATVMSTPSAKLREDKLPQKRYRDTSREGEGRIGLTMFGGSSTVSRDSPAAFGQIGVSASRYPARSWRT